MFVVVDGVPSIGIQIMVGSGKIEAQKPLALGSLPYPSMPQSPSSGQNGGGGKQDSSASPSHIAQWNAPILSALLATALTILS